MKIHYQRELSAAYHCKTKMVPILGGGTTNVGLVTCANCLKKLPELHRRCEHCGSGFTSMDPRELPCPDCIALQNKLGEAAFHQLIMIVSYQAESAVENGTEDLDGRVYDLERTRRFGED